MRLRLAAVAGAAIVLVGALACRPLAGTTAGSPFPSSTLPKSSAAVTVRPSPDPRSAACGKADQPSPSARIEGDDETLTPAGHWLAAQYTPIEGEIVATPAAYLASVVVDPSATEPADRTVLCVSTDLIHWQAPGDSSLFVNESGTVFTPFQQLTVTGGYAAITAPSCTWGYPYGCPDGGWYSADGVHWRTGIPEKVKYTPFCGDPNINLDGCMRFLWTPRLELLLEPTRTGSTTVSTDAGVSWQKSNLPARFEIEQLVRTEAGLFVAFGAQFPPPGGMTGGNPPWGVFVSRDGVAWSKAVLPPGSYLPKVVVLGSTLIVATRDEDFLGFLWSSSDGARTWTQMADATGRPLLSQDVQVAGDQVVVFGLGRTIAWVGTPN